jgi:hypothetical protein
MITNEHEILAATDAETVYVQCDHAATTIQERFRRTRRGINLPKAWLREDEETLENISTLKHGQKSSDELTEEGYDIERLRNGEEGRISDAKDDDDEKTESSEEGIDRSDIYTAIFVAIFSCGMMLFRWVVKTLGRSSDVEVTDAVNPNVVQSGGGGGGGAPQPPP